MNGKSMTEGQPWKPSVNGDGDSVYRYRLLIVLGMTVCISALVWIFAGNIISLFGLSNQAAMYCYSHLRTVALVNIILSLYIPLFGVFQAANHGAAGTLVATGALSVRVLVTYESYDFAGKTIILFATSGSSSLGDTANALRGSVDSTTVIKDVKILNGNPSVNDLKEWISTLGL